ncbi:hypothetical protein B0H16DRAFT_1901962 [Mycena metata]|uniref:Uncharacterized protein n=1 Tax=Mycena metata TaxID=1033252 RepID=A0AAD7GT31_9AGAR|nr:hypothetical protein B0H16DRAFT_1901962 [Mycena metata]
MGGGRSSTVTAIQPSATYLCVISVAEQDALPEEHEGKDQASAATSIPSPVCTPPQSPPAARAPRCWPVCIVLPGSSVGAYACVGKGIPASSARSLYPLRADRPRAPRSFRAFALAGRSSVLSVCGLLQMGLQQLVHRRRAIVGMPSSFPKPKLRANPVFRSPQRRGRFSWSPAFLLRPPAPSACFSSSATPIDSTRTCAPAPSPHSRISTWVGTSTRTVRTTRMGGGDSMALQGAVGVTSARCFAMPTPLRSREARGGQADSRPRRIFALLANATLISPSAADGQYWMRRWFLWVFILRCFAVPLQVVGHILILRVLVLRSRMLGSQRRGTSTTWDLHDVGPPRRGTSTAYASALVRCSIASSSAAAASWAPTKEDGQSLVR